MMKKHLLSFLTIALAVVGSAFTVGANERPELRFEEQLWVYEGTEPATDLLAQDQENYRPGTSEDFCVGDLNLCTIMAEEDPSNPGHPLISGEQIASDIAAYFADRDNPPSTIVEKQ